MLALNGLLLPLALVYYGRLTAVLEQGARAQGQIPWLELYYPRGFLPWVGLREPLREPLQSVLPFLERRGRSDSYLAQLNSLANALQNTGEPPQDSASFGSWCTRYLSHDRSPKPELPLKSMPRDAPLYAQGYLVERQTLQPTRPPLPGEEDLFQFCWDYHQGRLLTWNIADNDPGLAPGVQLGIRDRRDLTAAAPAGRPGPTSSKPA